MRWVALMLAGLSMPAWAATYFVLTSPYNSLHAHTACAAGVCADYAQAMRITGSFTTAAPLAANLVNQEISALVTSYSFSDGVNTVASSDANARVDAFFIQTDAAGKPVSSAIFLQQWQTTAPHTAGTSRVNEMFIGPGGGNAVVNTLCNGVGTSPTTGVADTCTTTAGDSATSTAFALFDLRFAVGAPVPVPVMTPVTFNFQSPAYSSIVNHTNPTCTTGVCATYTSAMRITGSLTLIDRLPSNLPATDIEAWVSSFSFSDGAGTTFASGDPNVRFQAVTATTDGAGAINAAAQVGFLRWQSGIAPHVVGNRVDYVTVSGTGGQSGKNSPCGTIGPSLFSGQPDGCVNLTNDGDTSLAATFQGGSWTAAAPANASSSAVPALTPIGLAALMLLFALAGVFALRLRA